MRAGGYGILALAWLLAVPGCASGEDRPGFEKNSLFSRQVNENPYWNEMALYLAGMPPVPGGELAMVSKSRAATRHATIMNHFWSHVERQTLQPINVWRARALPANDSRTLLYPLSGADFLNAHAFFPDARRTVMIALEPPGEATDPRTLSEARQAAGLQAIRVVIASMATRNYLYSATMSAYKGGQFPFRGNLPAILLMAARFGMDVVNVEDVGLDADGKLVQLKADGAEPAVRGIRVYVRDGGLLKEIVYLNIALSNRAVHPSTPAGAYLHSLGELNVMMKAAIYLLHRDGYGDVREFLLKKARVIVQDDSGIPFEHFDQKRWTVDLYGQYTDAPRMADAGYWPQPALVQAFRWHRKPLFFSYGYGMLTRGRASNILVAVRK